jgi:photoactive yellow protein
MATAASFTIDHVAFERITHPELEATDPDGLDALSFGVIGLDAAGLADRYNATEAHLAGLSPQKVLGRHFFETVAQCMNNYMVAQRFEDEPDLDEIVPFVLTLRMRPTPVRLRMLQSSGAERRYVLIQR